MKYLIFFILLTASVSTQAQSSLVNHWETVVYDSTVWRYFPGTSDPGSSWMQLAFDDSAWPAGRGSVGYGDNDDHTTIAPVMSVFLRKKFTISNLDKIAEVVINVDYDDGFVAYLNGEEIARGNMGTGIPLFNQAAPLEHEASLYQGITPDHFPVDNELLIAGENILTIEVHNVNITSSDLTSSLFLSVGITDDSHTWYPTPSWFSPPVGLNGISSNLPVIVIDTDGQLITSDDKIIATMGIVDNGAGQRNGFKDPFNNYNGKISIEVHGESSQQFPKKSYRIETQTAAGDNLNVSLLGLPSENDWVLYAPYSDKSLLRNMLAYQLAQKLGRYYAPHFKFIEVVVNNEYQGVYMLVEKIKVDKNRVNVSKLKSTDISGDALTGGYLLRVDKFDAGDYPPFTPVPSPALNGEDYVSFQFYDPKGEDLVEAQRTYMEDFLTQFESALSGSNYTDSVTGYHHYIDEASFVDFMVVQELSKNIDAYVYSTYMYKNKDSKKGKLTMGPVWDFDLAFGNVNYNTNSQFAPGWTYSEQYRMFWFRRLITSQAFADSLSCRWVSLRKNVLSNDAILNTLDSAAAVLDEAQARNFSEWPVLGTYVWPNPYIFKTYPEEVSYLKSWITDRLSWVDSNIGGACGPPLVVTGIEPLPAAAIYPNPTSGSFAIGFSTPPPPGTIISVFNSMGECIARDENAVVQDLIWKSSEHNVSLRVDGFYYVVAYANGRAIFRSKLIKF